MIDGVLFDKLVGTGATLPPPSADKCPGVDCSYTEEERGTFRWHPGTDISLYSPLKLTS
jgi:hypothetical protein